MSFDSLGLNPALVAMLAKGGYTAPTPVQAQSIPLALAGHDLMVSAPTGSGKTAAFMLPALQRLSEKSALPGIGPRVLVLCPTRELAQQVARAGETYGRALKRVSVVTVVGGMPYPLQIKLLRQPVDVLVATPGRLLDYISRGRIDFSRCELLVLDEADRMLDMGFQEDIEQIFAALPAQRQTVMFSATFGGEVGRLAQARLNNPQRISLADQTVKHADIEQRVHYADNFGHKNRLLDHLLRDADLTQAIVFAATKRDADDLSQSLADQGFAAAALHGDMPQAKRNRTLTALRRGQIRVLVATDVAARGIDVPTISHVINYGMPMKAEDYVHRIGRTGRAGRSGIAITLLTHAERGKLRAIERFTTQRIAVHTIPGLEPREQPAERRPRPAGAPARSFAGKPDGARRFNKDFREGSREGFKTGGGGKFVGKPAFGGGARTDGGARRTDAQPVAHAPRPATAPRPAGARPAAGRPTGAPRSERRNEANRRGSYRD